MFGPFPNLPPFQRGRVDLQIVASKTLQGNYWDDPTAREVYVYLPPGYDSSEQRYPVVLVLPGYTGTGEKLLARGLFDVSLATRIDHLLADGCPPFIAVMPDCMTSLGGSQYVDSPAIGNYATFLVDEVRSFVEGRFRTTGAWGAVGKSSGGFGALHLAMENPGAFRAVASHAGDMGLDIAYLSELADAVRGVQDAGGSEPFFSESFWTERRQGRYAVPALNVLCMACAYSPDVERSPIPARLPVDLETGEVDFEVLAAWRAFDPIERVEAAGPALRDLDLLFIDAGDHDEYLLHLGARRFVRRLEQHGITHEHEEFTGGHRGTAWRYSVSLQKVASVLAV